MCVQQRLPETLVLVFHALEKILPEIWIVLHEVFKPPIQLVENMVQSLDEICLVMAHPNSTKILIY